MPTRYITNAVVCLLIPVCLSAKGRHLTLPRDQHNTLSGASAALITFHKRINLYVISRDKYFDLTNRIILWQTKVVAFFHSRKIKVIMATSTADAARQIEALLGPRHYLIDNLWLDSHGKYRKGYSSLMIGSDEYFYKNIADSIYTSDLKKIASYCDEHTNIGIGSCYAAADFAFPVPKNGSSENMHGDSLLKGLANIFKGSSVYASKSWVMAKPWILGSENALAGFPLERQYKDSIFLPVWRSMGEWHRYSTLSNKIEIVNTIYLSNAGEIRIQDHTYMDQKKARRKLARNLNRLRANVYDLSM